jgi:hypothetical protein
MNPLEALNQRQRQQWQIQPPLAAVSVEDHTAIRLLNEALAEIGELSELDKRQAKKREIIPRLMPIVKAYLASNSTKPNPVAVHVMIWLFDIGDIDEAVKLALFLIGRGFNAMPKKFDRNMETFVADCVYDFAAEQLCNGNPAEPYLGQVVQAMEKAKWKVGFICKGKLYAMAAKHAEMRGELVDCLKLIEKAEQVNPAKGKSGGAGVSGLKKKVQAILDKKPLSLEEF